MSHLIRCHGCGASFVPTSFVAMAGLWRLCPRCRGPLPPSGEVPTSDDLLARRRVEEAAA